MQRELQREGATQANIDALAAQLGYASADAMFLAAGRNELGQRAIQQALRGPGGSTGACSGVRAAQEQSRREERRHPDRRHG